VTRRLRDLVPPETIVTTDVGSIKLIVSQVWRSTQPLTFFESNGLSAMGYSLPAAMGAKLALPDRPVLCTMGDLGFSMVLAHPVRDRRVQRQRVEPDSSGARRGYVDYGVRYGAIDFAAVSTAPGAWSRRVTTLDELSAAVKEARARAVLAVIEVPIDPAEYHALAAPPRQRRTPRVP
jgi:acetolactate synthase-1/2/3 large subunit